VSILSRKIEKNTYIYIYLDLNLNRYWQLNLKGTGKRTDNYINGTKIDGLKIDPHKYSQLIFEKRVKAVQYSTKNGAGTPGYLMQENELDKDTTPFAKTNSQYMETWMENIHSNIKEHKRKVKWPRFVNDWRSCHTKVRIHERKNW
jgi:hypothetical protein